MINKEENVTWGKAIILLKEVMKMCVIKDSKVNIDGSISRTIHQSFMRHLVSLESSSDIMEAIKKDTHTSIAKLMNLINSYKIELKNSADDECVSNINSISSSFIANKIVQDIYCHNN
mgnify:CR=1 FL=1